MANLMDMLGGAQGLGQIARELGMNEGQVQSGAAALLPAVLGGFKKQAVAQGGGEAGLGGLMGMLGGLGGGGLLDSVLSPNPTPVAQGNELLGRIFGDKDVSRTVATQAATTSGVSPDLLKKLLPIVAMAAAGYMAKQGGGAGGGGGLGGLLGGLTGGQPTGAAPAQRQGGLAGLLDMNGDGNPLDDILGMAGKFMRR